jgi:putative oxidoreductase
MKGFNNWIFSHSAIASTGVPASLGLLVLRVWVGFFMAFAHGWGKLTGFADRAGQFPDPMGVSSQVSLSLVVFAEFFCSLALVLGLFTRIAAIPLIITMLVAAFVIHGLDPWAKKEFALLYASTFVTLLIAGPGKYSLDALMGGSKRL